MQNRFDLSRWNIGRNIIGGDGAFGAGSIQSNGNLGSLTVGGDIKGGKGDHTGKVSVFGNSTAEKLW